MIKGSVVGIWYFLIFLSHFVPRKLAIFLAKKLAEIGYFTKYKNYVTPLIYNLHQVYHKLSYTKAKNTALKVYQNFGLFIYEFMVLHRLTKKNFSQLIRVNNKNYLDEVIKKKKGVIVLTSHIGNWELGAAVLGVLGYNPTVVSLKQPSKWVRNFFKKQREKVGMKVVYIDQGLKPLLTILKKGGIVALLGDRVYGGKRVVGELFGKDYSFPGSIFEIQKRLNIPVLPAFCIREGDKYCVYFEPELQDGVKSWGEVLERYIKKYTSQWFAFRKLWV
jgi:KDO2-lipid IV(A) lauroyltransferase